MSNSRLNQLIRGVIALTHRGMSPQEAYKQEEQKQIRLYQARRYPDFQSFWEANKHFFPGKRKKPSLLQHLGWGSNGD